MDERVCSNDKTGLEELQVFIIYQVNRSVEDSI